MNKNKQGTITLKLTPEEVSYLNGFLEAQSIKLSFLDKETQKNKPIKQEFKILETLETKLTAVL